ncbi:phage tail protein [Streptomyces aurantiacus]|uniref:phage tail protein n=1 Tax=Streptomyces aurantiacus TaxID=47760 RepID=UPI0033231A4D
MDQTAAPAATYRFVCTVNGDSVAFNSASGLEVGYTTKERRDESGQWQVSTGQQEPLTISLRRGEPGSAKGVWAEWIAGAGQGERLKREVTISLLDESGAAPLVTWKVTNALPKEASAHDLDGDGTYEFEKFVLVGEQTTVQFH